MSEKIIRKINCFYLLRIPAEMRHELRWDAGTRLTAWAEKNKIFLRQSKSGDHKNLKFHLGKLNDQLSWTIPKCWRWYYGFKIGDQFEFELADALEKVLVLTSVKQSFTKPDAILKKMCKGGLFIPANMLRIIQIEPLGGVKIKTEQDKILLSAEKVNLAKYFISNRGGFQIPVKIRRELNLPPDAQLELSIENDAIVLKKHRDYDKFAILSKKTIDDTDEKTMAYFEKHKTNHKKIKREARL